MTRRAQKRIQTLATANTASGTRQHQSDSLPDQQRSSEPAAASTEGSPEARLRIRVEVSVFMVGTRAFSSNAVAAWPARSSPLLFFLFARSLIWCSDACVPPQAKSTGTGSSAKLPLNGHQQFTADQIRFFEYTVKKEDDARIKVFMDGHSTVDPSPIVSARVLLRRHLPC